MYDLVRHLIPQTELLYESSHQFQRRRVLGVKCSEMIRVWKCQKKIKDVGLRESKLSFLFPHFVNI